MRKYLIPEMELILLDETEIIITSTQLWEGEGSDDVGGNTGADWDDFWQ